MMVLGVRRTRGRFHNSISLLEKSSLVALCIGLVRSLRDLLSGLTAQHLVLLYIPSLLLPTGRETGATRTAAVF